MIVPIAGPKTANLSAKTGQSCVNDDISFGNNGLLPLAHAPGLIHQGRPNAIRQHGDAGPEWGVPGRT